MKIVCIAASYIPSNTANSIQVIKAAHALAELGHEVLLLVPGDGETAWEKLRSHYGLNQSFEIRWISENLSFRRYDFAYKAVRVAKKMRPDLVYTWVLQAGVLALWQGLPTVLELHDRVTGKFGPWLFHRSVRASTPQRVLTNTAALKRVIVADYQLDLAATDVVVAPNGVELARYQDLPTASRAREDLGLPAGFTAGYTGHFYAGRGMTLMLNLAKALPEINFLWVGGEPDDVIFWKKKLEGEQVENVTLTGFVANAILPQYQAAADVLLMPYGTMIAGSGGGNSAEIASPMKMFEYMAAGRAILTSDLPVIHEVLDAQSAVFCPPEDLNAWRTSLLALRADPLRREQLGNAARAAVEKYTWRARAARALAGFIRT